MTEHRTQNTEHIEHNFATSKALKPFILLLLALLLNTNNIHAQSQNWWKVDGNSNTTSTSFIGTTNNQPVIFKTDNTTRVQLPANGGVVFNHLQNIGTGLVKYDNNGNLIPFTFTTDSTKVLYADGTWRSINFSQSGWTVSGNKVYNTTQNIGIGITNPQFKLDVNGNARVTGTLYAGNILITDNVVADTASVGVINLGNNSSIVGNTNIIGNSTVTGNVGIGTGSPTVKLDVNGSIKSNGTITANTLTINQTATFTDKIAAYRIIPLPGDSLIRLGDSTIFINANTNYPNTINWTVTGSFKGFAIGNTATYATGLNTIAIGTASKVSSNADYSISIGRKVTTTSTNSITIGTGVLNTNDVLVNNISNSIMLGTNSNIPTLFISPSNGANTTGNVGIGTTYVPTGFKLAVNGKIICEEVNVKLRTAWPDYMFDPNYTKPTLIEFANHITQNGYLWNMPSATQVKQNGYNLAQMDVKLLENIELLAQYIIEQDKKITTLQNQLSYLMSELELLKKK